MLALIHSNRCLNDDDDYDNNDYDNNDYDYNDNNGVVVKIFHQNP